MTLVVKNDVSGSEWYRQWFLMVSSVVQNGIISGSEWYRQWFRMTSVVQNDVSGSE